MLEEGARGVDADPAQAVDLYSRAIDEGANVLAMSNLALLLKYGADGVHADPVRAVELCNNAIEEGDSVQALKLLANLLTNGAEDVTADPAPERSNCTIEQLTSTGMLTPCQTLQVG